jgi:hypothetical protein
LELIRRFENYPLTLIGPMKLPAGAGDDAAGAGDEDWNVIAWTGAGAISGSARCASALPATLLAVFDVALEPSSFPALDAPDFEGRSFPFMIRSPGLRFPRQPLAAVTV